MKHFVTEEDFHSRKILHVNYCPTMCSLQSQLLPLALPSFLLDIPLHGQLWEIEHEAMANHTDV